MLKRYGMARSCLRLAGLVPTPLTDDSQRTRDPLAESPVCLCLVHDEAGRMALRVALRLPTDGRMFAELLAAWVDRLVDFVAERMIDAPLAEALREQSKVERPELWLCSPRMSFHVTNEDCAEAVRDFDVDPPLNTVAVVPLGYVDRDRPFHEPPVMRGEHPLLAPGFTPFSFLECAWLAVQEVLDPRRWYDQHLDLFCAAVHRNFHAALLIQQAHAVYRGAEGPMLDVEHSRREAAQLLALHASNEARALIEAHRERVAQAIMPGVVLSVMLDSGESGTVTIATVMSEDSDTGALVVDGTSIQFALSPNPGGRVWLEVARYIAGLDLDSDARKDVSLFFPTQNLASFFMPARGVNGQFNWLTVTSLCLSAGITPPRSMVPPDAPETFVVDSMVQFHRNDLPVEPVVSLGIVKGRTGVFGPTMPQWTMQWPVPSGYTTTTCPRCLAGVPCDSHPR